MKPSVKILGLKNSERFVIRRAAVSAVEQLRKEYPDLQADITGIKDMSEILRYTSVLMAPSLVVNEKLVCVGRYPRREEIIGWLREAMSEMGMTQNA